MLLNRFIYGNTPPAHTLNCWAFGGRRYAETVFTNRKEVYIS